SLRFLLDFSQNGEGKNAGRTSTSLRSVSPRPAECAAVAWSAADGPHAQSLRGALPLSETRRSVSDGRRAVDGRVAGDRCERGGTLGVRVGNSPSAGGDAPGAPVYRDRAPAGISVHCQSAKFQVPSFRLTDRRQESTSWNLALETWNSYSGRGDGTAPTPRLARQGSEGRTPTRLRDRRGGDWQDDGGGRVCCPPQCQEQCMDRPRAVHRALWAGGSLPAGVGSPGTHVSGAGRPAAHHPAGPACADLVGANAGVAHSDRPGIAPA